VTPHPGPIPSTPEQARRSHLESPFWRRVLIGGLRTIPRPVQHATMPLWSALFYLQVPHVRRAIESNLSRLLGRGSVHTQLLAFRTFTNYCQSIANAYLPYLGLDPGLDVQLQGEAQLRDILRPDRGAILATGHLGNWQLGPLYLDQHGFPPVTVVMTEEPDQDTQRMVSAIRDHNTHVVYPGRSPLLSLELRAHLQRGELIAFQMDRPSADAGLQVPFAGGVATFAAGPAVLARVCDAPVVPVFFPVEHQRLRIVVHPPLWAPHTAHREQDVMDATVALARVYETVIRRHPDQWYNFYDFWAAPPCGG